HFLLWVATDCAGFSAISESGSVRGTSVAARAVRRHWFFFLMYRGNPHARRRACYLFGRHSDFVSRQSAAARWPCQTNRACHRHHPRRAVAPQIYRGVLATDFSQQKAPACRGFLVSVQSVLTSAS